MSKDLEETMQLLKKQHGDNVVSFGNDLQYVRRMRLEIPSFDYVTCGGIPVNRITELYGEFSSLKSYFAYKAIAKFQSYDWANNEHNAIAGTTVKRTKKKIIPEVTSLKLRRGYKPEKTPRYKYCVLFDVEGTYDKVWGEKLGIDNEALILLSPSSMNVAVDIMEAFLSNPDISLVVLDSMSAVGSDAETDASMENEQMAVNARFWNKATRKITASINRNPEKDITYIAINSAYSKVGFVMGNPEEVRNGASFKLAKTMSVRCAALKVIEEKIDGVKTIVGRNVSLRNKKNKVGIPFRNSELYFSFVNDGILKEGETDTVSQLLTLAIQNGMIERRGAYYTFKEETVQGFDNLRDKVAEDPKFYNDLYKTVYEEVI